MAALECNSSRFLLSVALVLLIAVRTTLADDHDPPDPRYPPSQEEIYHELSSNTEFLLKSDFGTQETANSNLQRIAGSLMSFGSFNFSVDYRYGLAVDSWQVGQITDAIRHNAEVQTKWTDVLTDVADDLHAKVSFASLFIPKTGIGGTPASAVNINEGVLVTATTLDKDRHETSGYEVWFCLKGLIHYPDHYDHFDLLSSPTKCTMAAGNYVFWTQKGSDQGSRVIVKGIGDREAERRIDLPTP